MCLFPSPFSQLIYSEYAVILDLVKYLLTVQWVVVHGPTGHMQIWSNHGAKQKFLSQPYVRSHIDFVSNEESGPRKIGTIRQICFCCGDDAQFLPIMWLENSDGCGSGVLGGCSYLLAKTATLYYLRVPTWPEWQLIAGSKAEIMSSGVSISTGSDD